MVVIIKSVRPVNKSIVSLRGYEFNSRHMLELRPTIIKFKISSRKIVPTVVVSARNKFVIATMRTDKPLKKLLEVPTTPMHRGVIDEREDSIKILKFLPGSTEAILELLNSEDEEDQLLGIQNTLPWYWIVKGEDEDYVSIRQLDDPRKIEIAIPTITALIKIMRTSESPELRAAAQHALTLSCNAHQFGLEAGSLNDVPFHIDTVAGTEKSTLMDHLVTTILSEDGDIVRVSMLNHINRMLELNQEVGNYNSNPQFAKELANIIQGSGLKLRDLWEVLPKTLKGEISYTYLDIIIDLLSKEYYEGNKNIVQIMSALFANNPNFAEAYHERMAYYRNIQLRSLRATENITQL